MFSRKKQTELSILIFPRLKPISDRILYEFEKISSSDDNKIRRAACAGIMSRRQPFVLSLAYAVLLNDIVHVLVAASGEVDEDGALVHLPGQLHGIGNSMRTLDGRNDTLHPGKLKEGINGFVIGHHVVLYAP